MHKNSPFPSCVKPPFQVRSHCYVMKMTLYSHFHKRGLALILALKVRAFRTRKWPILSTTVVPRENEKQCFCKRETRLIIECFHMTSRRPYWCPKTMKRPPCWCPKPVLWELNSFLMQMLSFVPINLHRCWPRE